MLHWTIDLNGKSDMESLTKGERKVVKKSSDPEELKTAILQKNSKVEEYFNTDADTRWRRLKFDGHIETYRL